MSTTTPPAGETPKWVNQTALGKHFGITAVQVGKQLTAAGLKDGSDATGKALTEGYAQVFPLADGTIAYKWDQQRTIAALSAVMGVESVDPKTAAYALKVTKQIKTFRQSGKHEVADAFLAALTDEKVRALVERNLD